MNDNIYASPEAKLDVTPPVTTEDHFYVVSAKKFLVLYLSTLGFYSLYWFFKNWKQHKLSSGEEIWPIPRALFSIFFVHALFRRVYDRLVASQHDFQWKHGELATILVVSMLIQRVCDRLAMKEIGSPYTDAISLLFLFIMTPVFLRAQKMINLSCNDPSGESNSTFTAANFIWIALGSLLWLGFIASLFIE